MDQWHPAPKTMIDDELIRVWTRDNPAPDLVIHMVLISRIERGAPWGKTRLMRWAGITDYKARQAIRAAEQWIENWIQPVFNRVTFDPNAHQSVTIPNGYADDSTGELPVSTANRPSRASSSDTHTLTNTLDAIPEDVETEKKEPQPDPRRAEAHRGWDKLNEKRAAARVGLRSLTISDTSRNNLVNARKSFTAAEILHAWDWLALSSDDNPRWWQSNQIQFDLDTFVRRKHLPQFVNQSRGWSLEHEQQLKQQQSDSIEMF